MPDYQSLYNTYKLFVKKEQSHNQEIIDGAIDYYSDSVGVPDHFSRNDLDRQAKSEQYMIKRIILLNIFEHIAAMNRAHLLRGYDYQNYFEMRDESLLFENSEMDKALAFAQEVLLTEPRF